MSQISANIFLGVLSGVITSALLSLFISFFRNNISPYLEKINYKNVYLNGKWIGGGKHPNTSTIKAVIEAIQKGSKVSGIFSAETIRNGKTEYTNQYNLSGKIKNNVLILTYEATSNTRTGAGVALLRICDGGNKLSGQILHSENTSNIYCIPDFELTRSL